MIQEGAGLRISGTAASWAAWCVAPSCGQAGVLPWAHGCAGRASGQGVFNRSVPGKAGERTHGFSSGGD